MRKNERMQGDTKREALKKTLLMERAPIEIEPIGPVVLPVVPSCYVPASHPSFQFQPK